MKRIAAMIKGGKLILDFTGYEGGACEVEALRVRTLLAKLGMQLEVEYDETKLPPDKQAEVAREKEYA